MNHLTVIRALLVCASLLVWSGVRAADFNITIPLQLRNLPPNIDAMLVACWIYTNEPRLGGRNIGIGRGRVNITGGAYVGSTTVHFDANPGVDPATASHYQCQGSFVGDEDGATVHYFTSGLAGSTRFPLADGAPFRLDTGVHPIP